MISSAIRIVSKAICLLLVASFAMFVVDEFSSETNRQLAIANGSAQAQVVRDVHGRKFDPNRSELRLKIDGANDAVLAVPEQLVSDSRNPWVLLGVPFLLGIVFFGIGGHLLAGWLAAAPTKTGAAPIDREFRPRYTPGYR